LKQPSILDVVHGVKAVAPAHPEVVAWWYTPPQRLRLAGELPARGESLLSIERCEQIAKELSLVLRIAVDVRTHRGTREERPLFRIVSGIAKPSPESAPRPV
jgi:hypothetical protein